MATMKAVRVYAYGGPEVLKYEDAPRPKPGPGELLIRVHAAGVNPVDWKVREGYLKDVFKYSMPYTPGWDVSGVVEAAGAGAVRFKKGDEVFSFPDHPRYGAYAEYMAVKETELAPKPKTLDHAHAAAVPAASLTAWQALFGAGGLRAGQKVLIHGAAGGVGGFAVQLAKWKGAHVIGTASARNQDFLRQLGADEAIDYAAAKFEEIVRDVDVVFDTIGGETQARSWQTLKKGGMLVSTVSPPPAEEAARRGVRQGMIMVQPNAAQLAEIAGLIDSGKVKVFVETVLPLSEARRAQEMSQTGHTRGKIVLRVVSQGFYYDGAIFHHDDTTGTTEPSLQQSILLAFVVMRSSWSSCCCGENSFRRGLTFV
ncbi:MAG: NADP-dependent oxidoreductase [Candidatus Brocadiia bacterium]|jgi:NADPH:quinone reductase-like Zn-dependent oxidoreductase